MFFYSFCLLRASFPWRASGGPPVSPHLSRGNAVRRSSERRFPPRPVASTVRKSFPHSGMLPPRASHNARSTLLCRWLACNVSLALQLIVCLMQGLASANFGAQGLTRPVCGFMSPSTFLLRTSSPARHLQSQ